MMKNDEKEHIDQEENVDSDDLVSEDSQLEKSFRCLSRQQLERDHHKESSQKNQLKSETPTQSAQNPSEQNIIISEDVLQPLEMMFILFSSFKEDLVIVGSEFGCRVKILTNKIRITVKYPKSEPENQEQCKKKLYNCLKGVKKFLEKISYIQFKSADDQYRFYNSPHLQKKAQQYLFWMTKFNHKILCFSDKLTQDQIKKYTCQLFGRMRVFSLNFRNPRFKMQEIHLYFMKYLKLVTEHERSEFQQRQVVVEIAKNQCAVNCIGSKQRNVLASKNIIKNHFQSANIITIRYDNSFEISQTQVNKIKEYVRKISPFPIIGDKIHRKSLVFISKDNILKSLFTKSKFLELLELNNKCEVSIYFLRLSSFNQKKDCVQKICHKKGYDLMTLGGIYLTFKKVFMSENQQAGDIKQVIQLLVTCLIALRELKRKWDVPTVSTYKPKKKNQYSEDTLQGEYYSTGDNYLEPNLSQLLGRDIMIEKLMMGKKSLVKYNICEAEEASPIYWYTLIKRQEQQQDSSSQQQIKNYKKIECQPTDIEKQAQNLPQIKEFFIGKRKILGGEKIYCTEGKIIII